MAAEQVLYEIATNRLEEQIQRIDTLDAKGNTTITFGTGVLAVFGILVSTGQLPTGKAHNVFFALLIIGLLTYVWLLYKAYLAYQIAGYSFRPTLENLHDYSLKHTVEETQLRVAEECMESIRTNETRLGRKANHLWHALLALPIEAVALLAAALTILLSH